MRNELGGKFGVSFFSASSLSVSGDEFRNPFFGCLLCKDEEFWKTIRGLDLDESHAQCQVFSSQLEAPPLVRFLGRKKKRVWESNYFWVFSWLRLCQKNNIKSKRRMSLLRSAVLRSFRRISSNGRNDIATNPNLATRCLCYFFFFFEKWLVSIIFEWLRKQKKRRCVSFFILGGENSRFFWCLCASI